MSKENPLYRQVHPSFCKSDTVSVQAFIPTSQVFKPTPKDNMKLSVDDGTKIDAKSSFERFIQNPACQSVGVLSVYQEECKDLNLPVADDPLANNPEHMLIDFAGKTPSAVNKLASKLKEFAWQRGWVYQP